MQKILWGLLLFGGLLMLSNGCKDEKVNYGSGDGDSDSDTDGDGDGDTDGDADADVAVAALCHSLVVEGAPIDLRIVIGDGSDAVALTAGTYECSTGAGGSCVEIPVGDAMPIAVYMSDDSQVFTGNADLAAGEEYLFEVDLDDSNEVGVLFGALNEDHQCSEAECIMEYYTEDTCASEDFCQWKDDGNCDAYCEDTFGSDAFDDSADCAVDCDNIEDRTTCVMCNCEGEFNACFGNTECSTLISCAEECEIGDTECITACIEAAPDGQVLFAELSACMTSNCAEFE